MNLKLLFGVSLVIISLVVGKITTITFILYFNYPWGRYLSLAIYLLSWLLLLTGIYICGVEGAGYIKKVYKYFSYKHYHEHVKRYSRDVGHYAMEAGRKYRENMKSRIKKRKIYKNKNHNDIKEMKQEAR